MKLMQDICRSLYLRIPVTPKSIFKMIDNLLNRKKKSPLPDHSSASELASSFNTYFIDKVTN